jgi:uncharacterized OB-fold protein
MSTSEESIGISLLVANDKNGPYLVGGECTSCKAISFPMQSICPRCTGTQIGQVHLSRRGKLYTFTEVFQKPPDYEGPVPYFIGRVQLPEGVFILSQLKAKREDLHINLDMELLVEPLDTGDACNSSMSYKFRPVAD